MTRLPAPVELDLDAAVDLLVRNADGALRARGRADLVIPGGRGLLPLLEPLAVRGLPGAGWRLHLSDERIVPRGHPDRNVDALAPLLRPDPSGSTGTGASATVPGGPVVLGPPDGADGLPSAAAWAAALADVPRFAATILGIGPDGHTAGLFPGRTYGAAPDAPDVLRVDPAGALPHARVTMSARRLAHTTAVLLVAVGPGKEAAVDAVRRGADTAGPTGALAGPPRYLLVVPGGGTSRKSARV